MNCANFCKMKKSNSSLSSLPKFGQKIGYRSDGGEIYEVDINPSSKILYPDDEGGFLVLFRPNLKAVSNRETLADVVRYEREELENEVGLTEKQIKELEKYSDRAAIWVTKIKDDAQRYVRE